ncbi:MAG: rhodanese-like domain-containing protein [Pseudomonadota bacterium]
MDHAFTSPDHLAAMLHRPDAPAILDLRTPQDAATDPTRLPAARRATLAHLTERPIPDGPAVVYCQKGGKISQLGAALLRRQGVMATALTGGHLAWAAKGLPVQSLDPIADRWVMRLDPDWAELATLWTLRRLVDPDVPVLPVARDQRDAAATVWAARRLPATPVALAEATGLTHPILSRLDAPAAMDAFVRGRLARTGDPEAALDLIDDWLAARDVAA